MTDTTRYDGEGEGGMCTLVYETRGQSDRAIGNTWENYFDISSDLKRRTFDENGKFEVYSKNMVYNFFSSENNYIIPSWMMHNSPYDCQLNCPRGNYWEITNVERFLNLILVPKRDTERMKRRRGQRKVHNNGQMANGGKVTLVVLIIRMVLVVMVVI